MLVFTAEVTGSIPVTPTSQNAPQARTSGPFARRFARRPGLRVVASGQRRSIRAAGKPRGGCGCQDERLIVGFPGAVLTSGGLGLVVGLLPLLGWGRL
jgi:hypothetical protein